MLLKAVIRKIKGNYVNGNLRANLALSKVIALFEHPFLCSLNLLN